MMRFQYLPKSTLHVCNKQMACSDKSYERLVKKEKIHRTQLEIIKMLLQYRLLTKEMISFCVSEDDLQKQLDALSEYGLIIKQFYEGRIENEQVKSCTFYAVSPHLPNACKEAIGEGRYSDYVWSREIRIENAMAILSFNQFHFCLKHIVPRKYIQTQVEYQIGQYTIDGRYCLKNKGRRYGYSHLLVISVRDYGQQNMDIVSMIKWIDQFYRENPQKGKLPWYILLCENEAQCANINRHFSWEDSIEHSPLYYVLDSDVQYGENPLHVLQMFHFKESERDICSEVYSVENWW